MTYESIVQSNRLRFASKIRLKSKRILIIMEKNTEINIFTTSQWRKSHHFTNDHVTFNKESLLHENFPPIKA